MEVQALRGAQNIIERCKPKIMVEVISRKLHKYGESPASLQKEMERMGYSEVWRFKDGAQTASMPVLFEHHKV